MKLEERYETYVQDFRDHVAMRSNLVLGLFTDSPLYIDYSSPYRTMVYLQVIHIMYYDMKQCAQAFQFHLR